MKFSELNYEQLNVIDGGCTLCTVGGTLGGASTIGGFVFLFTPAGPAVVAGCVVGGILGYVASR